MSGHLAIAARRAWWYKQIRGGVFPPPDYGSTEWCDLADDDPAKLRAALVAAECWAVRGDDQRKLRVVE